MLDSSVRRNRIFIFAFTLLAVQAVAGIIPGKKLWPFASYRMFSKIPVSSEHSHLEISGISSEGVELTFDLNKDFAPFNLIRLRSSLWHALKNNPHENQAQLVGLFDYLHARYQACHPKEPSISELQVYKVLTREQKRELIASHSFKMNREG